jgi:hypothetical protein
LGKIAPQNGNRIKDLLKKRAAGRRYSPDLDQPAIAGAAISARLRGISCVNAPVFLRIACLSSDEPAAARQPPPFPFAPCPVAASIVRELFDADFG